MNQIAFPRDPRSLNAYRHGLTGQIVIMTPEDQAAYESHCQGIHKSLAPEGALEVSLVQSIADDRWRLLRSAAIDNSRFAMGLSDPDSYTTPHPEVATAFSQAVTWASDAHNLNLLSLYEGRIQRRVERNLAMLKQLQAERQAALRQAAEEAALLAQLAASQGEPYDIERDFPLESLPPQFVFSTARIARLAAHNTRLANAKSQFPAPKQTIRRAA